jgi:sortase A
MIPERISGALSAVGLGFAILAAPPVTVGLYSVGGRLASGPSPPPAAAPFLAEGELVARMTVPRVKLESPIFEGVGLLSLSRGAGHLPGTALPGAEDGGESVIAMARDRGGVAIAALRLGDRIRLTTHFGARHYRVVERRLLAPQDLRPDSACAPRVTLVTAYPADSLGPAPLRLAVVMERD